MTSEDAILEVSRWERELRANAIKVSTRERGSAIWGIPFIVQPKSWQALRRQARQMRNRFEYARVVGSEYVSVLG